MQMLLDGRENKQSIDLLQVLVAEIEVENCKETETPKFKTAKPVPNTQISNAGRSPIPVLSKCKETPCTEVMLLTPRANDGCAKIRKFKGIGGVCIGCGKDLRIVHLVDSRPVV
jgi:hypothetical protein